MSNITDNVLEEIKEKLTPKPKWHFLLKNYVFWLFLIFAIFIGALAVTVMLFMLLDYDWDIFEYLERNFFTHVFFSFPYFWLAVLMLFLAIAYYGFRHTRRGYRYEISKVVIGGLLASFGIGGILFWYGLDSEIHEMFSKQVPFYNNLVYTKEDIWRFPDKGLLGGEIIGIKDRENFELRDFDGKTWQIQGGVIDWPDDFIFLKGARIKLIGERRGEHTFFVKIVKPWDWNK